MARREGIAKGARVDYNKRDCFFSLAPISFKFLEPSDPFLSNPKRAVASKVTVRLDFFFRFGDVQNGRWRRTSTEHRASREGSARWLLEYFINCFLGGNVFEAGGL